jgi:hypothetical protein
MVKEDLGSRIFSLVRREMDRRISDDVWDIQEFFDSIFTLLKGFYQIKKTLSFIKSKRKKMKREIIFKNFLDNYFFFLIGTVFFSFFFILLVCLRMNMDIKEHNFAFSKI